MEAAEHDAAPAEPSARARLGGGDRTGGRAARRGRAAGDHGGHGPVLGSRRAGSAGAGGDAAHPGVPQRPGARLRAGGPRAVLLPRALAGAEVRGRGAGDRRADGLPPGLRRVVRRGDGDRGDRRGRTGARAPAGGGGGVLRLAARTRSRTCARLQAARRCRRGTGSASCARSRTSGARASEPSARTGARRFTRCGCMRSSAKCSTATRS